MRSKTSQFLRCEAGSLFYQTFAAGETLIRPSLHLGFVQKRLVGNVNSKGGLVNQPTLLILGNHRVRNQVDVGASLSAQFKDGFYVVGNINAELGSGQRQGDALLTLGYEF